MAALPSPAMFGGTELTDDHVHTRLDSLAKPPGSLGRLDDLSAELCRIQRMLTPVAGPVFDRPISIRVGEMFERDGFVFADLTPAGGLT